MSVVAHAVDEMKRAGFEQGDIDAMERILRIFFTYWDSGGAVWAMADVLQRLLNCQPLTPLTGADDEWTHVGEFGGEEVYQSKRAPSVFKNDKGRAYDIDVPGRPTITFPYDPTTKPVSSPVIEFEAE